MSNEMDLMRADFEAAYRAEVMRRSGKDVDQSVFAFRDGEYVIGNVQAAFWGFQAARQQAVPFQSGVAAWMMECFGQQIASDKTERNHRFLEEALELVQSCGCTDEEAHRLVDYVYGREVGEPSQEVGGVMVTLAALCLAQDLDMQACAGTELARITQPETVLKIREKQKRKPSMSPLPGSYPERTALAAAPQSEKLCVECGQPTRAGKPLCENHCYQMPAPQAEQAVEEEPDDYPECDYCGAVPDHHPWHGSGMLEGVESRHIHACDQCRVKLPAPPAPDVSALVHMFNQGYMRGHHDTVEGQFNDIHRSDMDTYHEDLVFEIAEDHRSAKP